MSDEPQQHDETVLPADAVEDLAPDDGDDVSGGALNAYLKLDSQHADMPTSTE